MPDIDEFLDDAPRASSSKTCSICGAKLSRYNKIGHCFRHEEELAAKRTKDSLDKWLLPFLSEFNLEYERQERADMLAYLAQEGLIPAENTSIDSVETTASTSQIEIDRQLGYEQPDRVIQCVCEAYSATLSDINAKYRGTSIMEARQVLMYLLYNDTRLSYPEIGTTLGGRDHTTVMHGSNKVESMLEIDRDLLERIRGIRTRYPQTS